jgi:vanillate/3-O-methylgallate O-demethylase
MSANNLEQLIQQAGGDVVAMLRNAQIGNFAFPMEPEYTNWRDEQEAWATTAALFDQSFHMTDVYFKGPDARKFFSETAVNSFANIARNKAKQFVAVSEDGYFIGDSIVFCFEEDEYALVGSGIAGNWAAYRAQAGGYDLEVTVDPPAIINPNPRKVFRFQVQGPNAMQVIEKAYGGPVPAVKPFNLAEFTLAGVPIRALSHSMVVSPGLELIGPAERGAEVWAVLAEAGKEFGLRQGGGLAYPTNAVEKAWIPFPVPAIYTGPAMKPYREHLSTATLEANYALAGSHVLPKIEDYYVTPWDIGYGKLVRFDHDFVGRPALEALAGQPHRRKVWLRWNPEDCGKVLASSLFDGKNRAKYLKQPYTDYGISQNDTVLMNGRVVGVSTYSSYTVNIGSFASIGLIDEGDAKDGAEVTLIWGEPDGGTSKPNVERHVQREIRATISLNPLT